MAKEILKLKYGRSIAKKTKPEGKVDASTAVVEERDWKSRLRLSKIETYRLPKNLSFFESQVLYPAFYFCFLW